MPISVTVGLAPSPARDFMQGLRHPEDFEMPWEQRERIELEVEESESFRSVLDRAGEALGVSGPDWAEARLSDGIAFFDFYRSGEPIRLQHEIALLDDHRRVIWRTRWLDTPYGALVEAADAGVLDGDPRRPYLLLQPGIGNGVLATLQMLAELWPVFWQTVDVLWNEAADDVLKGWGLYEILKRLTRSRARQAPEVLRNHSDDWERRGARPDNLQRLLIQDAWNSDGLSGLLGCTQDEAETLLLAFGCTRQDDGLWRPQADEEATFLHQTVDLLIHAPTSDRDALRQVLLARLRALGATGRAPELDWERLFDELPDDPDILERIMEQHQEAARKHAERSEEDQANGP